MVISHPRQFAGHTSIKADKKPAQFGGPGLTRQGHLIFLLRSG
jgi:hypothetical protein